MKCVFYHRIITFQKKKNEDKLIVIYAIINGIGHKEMSVLSIRKQVIETKDIEQKVPAKNKANKKINSYSHQSSCLKEIKVFADLISNDTLKQNKKYYFEKIFK